MCSYIINRLSSRQPSLIETIFKLFENIGKCEFSVPNYVDKVLESLLRAMLSLEPQDRPDIPTIRQHDWSRKRFPRTGKVRSFSSKHYKITSLTCISVKLNQTCNDF